MHRTAPLRTAGACCVVISTKATTFAAFPIAGNALGVPPDLGTKPSQYTVHHISGEQQTAEAVMSASSSRLCACVCVSGPDHAAAVTCDHSGTVTAAAPSDRDAIPSSRGADRAAAVTVRS